MRRDVEAMYKELMWTLIQFRSPTDYSGAMRGDSGKRIVPSCHQYHAGLSESESPFHPVGFITFRRVLELRS